MLIVIETAQKWDFCEKTFLSFCKANHSIWRDQIVDLFYVSSRIQIIKEHCYLSNIKSI